jgi:hypothetical protein
MEEQRKIYIGLGNLHLNVIKNNEDGTQTFIFLNEEKERVSKINADRKCLMYICESKYNSIDETFSNVKDDIYQLTNKLQQNVDVNPDQIITFNGKPALKFKISIKADSDLKLIANTHGSNLDHYGILQLENQEDLHYLIKYKITNVEGEPIPEFIKWLSFGIIFITDFKNIEKSLARLFINQLECIIS